MSTTATATVLVERRTGRARTARPTALWLAVLSLRCGETLMIALAGTLGLAIPAIGYASERVRNVERLLPDCEIAASGSPL